MKDITGREYIYGISQDKNGAPYLFNIGELVRCKDCRHSDTNGVHVEGVVYCKWLDTSCIKNGYCHRGKRKGGDDE